MAELIINKDERLGILKEIDEGAIDLVLQNSQIDIYSFPIPSFIRETISNGLDAIVERDIANQILGGDKSEEEFFLQRTDDKLLKDSSFDPTYYSPKFLSNENRVFVDYVTDHPRDCITIKDVGVGLGGSRLQGYFNLGYSSKRNMKDVIGKFGSGSKSALATGVDYFIMYTVYNGYKTSFMIFLNDYEAITPQHPQGREDVWRVKMADGSLHDKTIYWEPAAENNSVSVELEVKKHNKNAFIKAVKNQFQYFGGKVRLAYENDDGNGTIDHLNETPLYESDYILIPQFSTYSVPHILVDGISYGPIDFPELEIEKMRGKIALKVRATDVDITQSRETLKYTERTKKAILALVEQAREEATDYVTQLLDIKEPENIFMMNDTYGRLAKDGSTAVASVFSKFLSMHNIKPKFEFKINKKVWDEGRKEAIGAPVSVKARLDSTLFEFLFYNWNVKELTTEVDGKTLSIDSRKVDNFASLRYTKIVFAKEASLGPKLTNHLLEKFNIESIIYIRPRTDRSKSFLEEPIGMREFRVTDIDEYVHGLLMSYADLDLDKYDVKYDETVKDVEELDGAVISTELTPAQERKLNQEVLYTYYKTSFQDTYGSGVYVERARRKRTIKVSKISSEFDDGEKVLITTGTYTKLAHFIEMTQIIFPDPDSRLKIIYVAQDKVRYFSPHGTLITDYFRTINPKTGELMIGEHIRNLNTLKHLYEVIEKYSEFSSKSNIIEAFTTVDVQRIMGVQEDTKKASPREILEDSYNTDKALVDDIFGYLDVLTEFHHVVKTGDKELIAKKAMECFASDEVYTVDAYDEEFIHDLETQFNHLSVVSPLLDLLSEHSGLEDVKPLIELLINTKHKEQDELKL